MCIQRNLVDQAFEYLISSAMHPNELESFVESDTKTAESLLRARCDALRLAFAFAKEILDDKVSVMEQHYNAEQAVSRLPAEIVALIAAEHLWLVSHHNYYLRLLQLTRVCKHWCNVLRTCPSLWTRIDGDRPGLLPIVLERSGSHILSIRHWELGDWGRWVAFSTPYRYRNNRIVTGGLARCRTAFFTLYQGYTKFGWSKEYFQAPLLEELMITGRKTVAGAPSSGYEAPVDIWEAPRLRNLEISRLPFEWASPIFFQLHTLQLSSLDNSHIRAVQLFQLLRNCNSLQRLELKRIELNMGEGELPESLEEIELPCLTSLHIAGMVPFEMESLLEGLQVPLCTELNLAWDCRGSKDDAQDAPFWEVPQPILDKMLPTLGEVQIVIRAFNTEFDYRLCGWAKGVNIDDQDPSVNILGHEMPAIDGILPWVWQVFGQRLVEPHIELTILGFVDLDFELEDGTPDPVLADIWSPTVWGQMSPFVWKLIYEDFELEPVHPVLKAMSNWRIGDRRTISWPFPNLEVLEIMTGDEEIRPSRVLNALRERHRGPPLLDKFVQTQRPLTINLPTPLKKLRLVSHRAPKERREKKTLLQLGKLLGEDVVREAWTGSLPFGWFPCTFHDEALSDTGR